MAGAIIPIVTQIEFDAQRINKAGGINGHLVEIVRFDNKLDPAESLVQLQKAIDSGIRYIAHVGGDAVASALINAINKNNARNPDKRVVYLNYGANGAQFTNDQCSFWHFLFDANTKMKMNTMTEWVASQPQFKKIYLINPEYSFGHDVSSYARTMLKERRPDIQIVGDIFVPLGKVKDFSPYVTQIKASGADTVITGNWGQDVTLLAKSMADYGLKTPLVTLYANGAGAATAIGKAGVDLIYLTWLWHGDYTDPEMAARQEEFKKTTGFDYGDLRSIYMMEMLKAAAEKADSIDPMAVAFALEDLQYEGTTGAVMMRGEDHQILVPLFLSVFKDGMKISLERTDGLNFHAVEKFPGEKTAMATSCKMKRPER